MARFGYHLFVWSAVLGALLALYIFYDGYKRRCQSDPLADVSEDDAGTGIVGAILGDLLAIGWLLTTLHWSRPPILCWCALPLLALLSVVGYLMWSTSFSLV